MAGYACSYDSTNGFCHGEPGSMKLRPAFDKTPRYMPLDDSESAGVMP